MNYKRIIKRQKEISKLYKQTREDKYLWEDDCICHFFECERYKLYENIANICITNNFNKIYDIGCAYGHQSEVFLQKKLEYIGINDSKLDFWNRDKFRYIVKSYPFKINTNNNDIAVSSLCLTWNCYLYEGEKTLKEQLESLQRDFKQCLLHLQHDKFNIVKEYFKYYKIVDDELIYFYN